MSATFPTSLSGPPAIRDGEPAFPDGLPLARPNVPDPEAVSADIRRILASGVLTNGPYVSELERRATEYLGVQHCVAVASCTSGLMLVLRVSDLSGDVVLPSFTFAATAHAVAWNGLRPVFADIDAETLTLSPGAAAMTLGVRTSAILATHTYGTPADVDALEDLARDSGIRLFFDAAHAFGASHLGTPVGRFGDAEVFSLTPTKPLVAGEGGIIATNDQELAERCRLGRDYGKEPNYDFGFVGLNARMSEFHAAVALASLSEIDQHIETRNTLASAYRQALAETEGVSFPRVPEGDRSTYKDLTILVDPVGFGLNADELGRALGAEGVETRRYYSPPVHATRAYRSISRANGRLPITEGASTRALTLPLWGRMTEDQVGLVALAIARIREHARRHPA
jgi:dTDP-4-amino-4,6-dideoxygalactose transaminase